MRLISFQIDHYRVLHELTIDFNRKTPSQPDPQKGYSLDFLAGVNGTGKSTVLHLLGRLFARLLTTNYYFPVMVELIYMLQEDDRQITVSNMPQGDESDSNGTLRYRVGDDEWQTGKIPSDLLPRQIVIYTTGNETVWLQELGEEDHGDGNVLGDMSGAEEVEAYLREMPGHREMQPDDATNAKFDHRTLLFIQSDRLNLVTLCGLLASLLDQARAGSPKAEILQDVMNSISLDKLLSFSLRIRSHRSLTPPVQQTVIEDLQTIANHRIQQGSDTLLVFDIQQQLARFFASQASIFDLYESPIALYQKLDYLYEHRPYYDAPLQQVSLFLRRQAPPIRDNATPVSAPMLQLYNWLSDGEQSFLGRMALFALFRAPNMLILLDEPEVHFNDVWKRQIVNMLDQIMTGQTSHALITTHSSIALTDVRSQDILVMHRQGQHTMGEDAVRPPNIETLGADPSDILVHVFGARSATGERSIRFIREEIGLRDTEAELNMLKAIVAPGYWRYRIQLEVQRLSS